jgi:hypothetical protein
MINHKIIAKHPGGEIIPEMQEVVNFSEYNSVDDYHFTV